ncbi:uncharacterized protein THITE_2111002 [Thermothielavioides terrestris NRRL 8126]|uniref:Uncharacterized protein n=1 Tax=Thermothielavioides terrestris (strain ATCC 38088 / NRRL 8126) TaxID=578455 RepID=G2QVX7_THETT|nr:uncharacterized protein THITE_2111002 [Thermothielavioides terrestris NRRL 8126]AEO64709.1 hypothetical protein THITE_2111002 [Thermothielavioides terrestris NRRL 8126]
MDPVDVTWRSRQTRPEDGSPSLTFALQTLLARHEAYMASAERDRLELTARIEQLERENTELEAKNKALTDENHNLRDELEQLNDAVKTAESSIELLEATLRDSQLEVRRLEIAADRAVSLERQIATLEEEQVVLRTTIARTEEEARTAMYRWRQAEKGLSDLQEQLERMEKEAREERERHVQAMARMERQRAVEKELNTAAGRLKGAAAVRSMTDSRHGGGVVSRFVRDLLQDNANLQVGIAELREMLLHSNDEIQTLREQLMYHQPVQGHGSASPATLQAELEKKEPPTPPRVSQELHIHHHYHVTHKPESRRPRKRRQGLNPGIFTPPPISAPGSPVASARWQRSVLAGPLSPTPLNDAAVQPTTHWPLQPETQAEFSPSSAPSSPRSTNRDSVFDRMPGLSSPASPTTSVDPASPRWKTAHGKRISEFSLRTISETAMFSPNTSRGTPGRSPRPYPLASSIVNDHSTRGITSPYTTDDVPSITSPHLGDYPDPNSPKAEPWTGEALSPTSSEFHSGTEQRPSGLRRVVSHESIISLSNGLDIHTLKARPSQLALRPLGLTAAGTNLSAVTARPTLSSGSGGGKRGSVILRDSIAQALPVPKARQAGARTVSTPVRGRERDRDGGRSSSRAPSALGKLVSWRPWGATSTSSTNETANPAPSPETSPSSTPVLSPAAAPPPSSSSAATAIPTLSLSGRAVDSSAASAVSAPIGMAKSPQGSVSSASTATATATAGALAASPAAASTPVFRAPGVNQPGAVPGFHEYWAAHQRRAPPSKVSVDDGAVVQEALREVLEESG